MNQTCFAAQLVVNLFSTARSNPPAWNLLVNRTLTTDERISLITTIVSDYDHVEMVGSLLGDDVHNVVDAIYKVNTRTFRPLGDGPINSRPNRCALCIRCWIASNHRSAGSACVFYTTSVAAMPCFRGHRQSHSLTTQRGAH